MAFPIAYFPCVKETSKAMVGPMIDFGITGPDGLVLRGTVNVSPGPGALFMTGNATMLAAWRWIQNIHCAWY